MNHRHRGVGGPRALMTAQVAGDQPQQRPPSGVVSSTTLSPRRSWYLGARTLSAAGGSPTTGSRGTARPTDELLGRGLDVEDAGTGRHPLGVAVADDAAAAVGVLVHHGPVDHVGDGLETAMGVPRRSLRLAGGVVDLAHLIEVDERVEVGQIDPVEGPPDREALALEAGGRWSPSSPADRWHRSARCRGRGSTRRSSTVTAGMVDSFVRFHGTTLLVARPIPAVEP